MRSTINFLRNFGKYYCICVTLFAQLAICMILYTICMGFIKEKKLGCLLCPFFVFVCLFFFAYIFSFDDFVVHAVSSHGFLILVKEL